MSLHLSGLHWHRGPRDLHYPGCNAQGLRWGRATSWIRDDRWLGIGIGPLNIEWTLRHARIQVEPRKHWGAQ